MLIQEILSQWKPIKRLKLTSSIRARLNAINKGLESERQYINPNTCKKTHEDFLKTRLKDSGNEIDDENGKRGHQVDAASYFDYNYYPIKLENETIYL